MLRKTKLASPTLLPAQKTQIINLRRGGGKIAQIAEAVGVCHATVIRVCRQAGLDKSALMRQRETQILAMSREKTTAEIAQALTISAATVRNVRAGLTSQGRLVRKKPGPGSSCSKIESERVQTIIRLKQNAYTNVMIGQELGITREWARQLVKKIINCHGPEVFERTGDGMQFWTIAEAAKTTNCPINYIHCLLNRGQLSSVKKGKFIYLDKIGLQQLKASFQQNCVVCGQTIVCWGRGRKTKICGQSKCQAAHRAGIRQACQNQEPSAESLRGLGRIIFLRLQNYRIPDDEQWLLLKEACERSGLTLMRLGWLRLRRVIPVKESAKRRYGKIAYLYPASVMDIIRELAQE